MNETDKDKGTGGFEFFLVFIGFALGIFVGIGVTTSFFHDESIKHNVAYYNPTNAAFTWKTIQLENK